MKKSVSVDWSFLFSRSYKQQIISLPEDVLHFQPDKSLKGLVSKACLSVLPILKI